MNVRRGLWRAWIFVTLLWVLGSGTLAYFLAVDAVSKNYQWLMLLRKDVKEPWKHFEDRSLYEIARSPSKEGLTVAFNPVDYEYVSQWNKDVDAGKTVRVDFPDHSRLYLNAQLTTEDQTYLSRAFWNQPMGTLGHRWITLCRIGRCATHRASDFGELHVLGWTRLRPRLTRLCSHP
jgi:hypothetical protein